MFSHKTTMIEGKRVRMRPLELTDLEYTLNWANDPEIAYYTGYIYPLSMEMEVRWYERGLEVEDRRNFVIEAKEYDKLIGHTLNIIGLTSILHIDWLNRKAELSMLIGDKTYWGKGYGRESVRTMLNHIFNVMGINKVYGRILDYNVAALKMDLGAGYTQEGYIKEDMYIRGAYHDKYLIGITRAEFNEQVEERGESY